MFFNATKLAKQDKNYSNSYDDVHNDNKTMSNKHEVRRNRQKVLHLFGNARKQDVTSGKILFSLECKCFSCLAGRSIVKCKHRPVLVVCRPLLSNIDLYWSPADPCC